MVTYIKRKKANKKQQIHRKKVNTSMLLTCYQSNKSNKSNSVYKTMENRKVSSQPNESKHNREQTRANIAIMVVSYRSVRMET